MRNIVISLMVAVALLVGANAEAAQNVVSPERRVVVLDAGHGGPRPGKVVGKTTEAAINLAVAKAIKEKLADKMPSLEVYLTRESNVALHEDRNVDNKRRAEFANGKGADLLLSIHANAASATSAVGTEVWILSLDEDTLKQNRKNGSAFVDEGEMMHVESISKSSMGYIIALTNQMNNDPFNNTFARLADEQFKALKRHSRGVKFNDWTVLYWLEGPGALVELGFMTNPDELAYMTSERGQDELADALADAIVQFINRLDQMAEYAASGAEGQGSTPTEEPAVEDAAKTTEEVREESREEGYAIQLLSSKRELDVNDSQFKSYRGKVTLLMGTGSYRYKYCLAGYATAEAAREELKAAREQFKDAYVVKYRGANIVK